VNTRATGPPRKPASNHALLASPLFRATDTVEKAQNSQIKTALAATAIIIMVSSAPKGISFDPLVWSSLFPGGLVFRSLQLADTGACTLVTATNRSEAPALNPLWI